MDCLAVIWNIISTQSNFISSSTQDISAVLQGGAAATQEIIQIKKKKKRRKPNQGGSRKGQAPNLWQDFESGYR
jgi:hypothetical protein